MAFTVEMSPLSARWAELDVACRQGDLTTVDRLISEAEADGTEMLEEPLTTALLVACFDGRVRVVERLLAAGADVEACYRGERALFGWLDAILYQHDPSSSTLVPEPHPRSLGPDSAS